MTKLQHNDDNTLVFLPLGGVEEVGLNASLYGYGSANQRTWVMVDCGLGFTGDAFAGIDVCIPAMNIYERERKRIKAFVITHAHEDHIGALGYYADMITCPVYLTPFAKALFEAKWPDVKGLKLITVNYGELIDFGDIKVKFLPVTHSIPESSALLIQTPEGQVVHSGDWKLDKGRSEDFGEVEALFRGLGDEGIEALICDSTNAPSQGYSHTEDEVEETLINIVGAAKGLVGITLFASNVRRLNAIARAAEAAGRQLIALGRAVERTIEVARSCGYFPEHIDVLGRDSVNVVARKKAVVIFSGSQGEANAALARSAEGEHPNFSFSQGDTMVFSSRAIPGNEMAIGRIINNLMSLGVRVVTDKEAVVHVSGHPRQNELSRLYEWLKPSKLVTVHGEPQHLFAQKQWARGSVGAIAVPQNGDVWRLAPGDMTKVDEVSTGRILIDGRMMYHEREPYPMARRKLSFAGVFVCSIVVDGKGKLVGEVYMDMVGIPQGLQDGGELDDKLFEAMMEAFEGLSPRDRLKYDKLEWRLKRAAFGVFRHYWNKKPAVQLAIHYLKNPKKTS